MAQLSTLPVAPGLQKEGRKKRHNPILLCISSCTGRSRSHMYTTRSYTHGAPALRVQTHATQQPKTSFDCRRPQPPVAYRRTTTLNYTKNSSKGPRSWLLLAEEPLPTCNWDIEARLVDAVVVPLRQYLAAVIVQRSVQIVLQGKGHNIRRKHYIPSAAQATSQNFPVLRANSGFYRCAKRRRASRPGLHNSNRG